MKGQADAADDVAHLWSNHDSSASRIRGAHGDAGQVSEITSAQAEESHGRWSLRVNWANKTAAFAYGGVFAEHLARVAETTIRGVMRPALPVLAQRRAAGA